MDDEIVALDPFQCSVLVLSTCIKILNCWPHFSLGHWQKSYNLARYNVSVIVINHR